MSMKICKGIHIEKLNILSKTKLTEYINISM